MKEIAIVGGGLSGLTAAHYIRQQRPDVHITVYEKAARFGGKMQTKHIDGYNVEMGPDSYLVRKPAMCQLVKELGLEDAEVKNKTDQAYIYDQDRLYPIPGGSIVGIPTQFIPFAQTRLLSWPAKIRAGLDYFKRPYPEKGDVSIGDFFEYHLGKEMVTKLIEPLMSGIYGGDIYQLSLDATFPQFHQLEQREGNMVKGMLAIKQKRAKRPAGIFRQLKGGLSSVIQALIDQIPDNITLQTDSDVTAIEYHAKKKTYQLKVNGTDRQADTLVLATPPAAYQGWFANDHAFDVVKKMPQSTCAIVMMSFDATKFDQPLKGTGFVITRTTNTPLTACTYVSNKWAATAPKDRVILRAFLGKPSDYTVQKHSSRELGEIALRELQRLLRFSSKPLWIQTKRLTASMPQYLVGHRKQVEKLKQHVSAHYANLYLIGMPYEGIGMPDCVRQAKTAAEQIAAN